MIPGAMMDAQRRRRTSFLRLLPLAICLYCFLCLSSTSAFNLDPRIPIIKHGDRGSYFGFSVAEHQQVSPGGQRKNQLLVGAPRANTSQPNTIRPGTVFVCPITTYSNDCQQIDLRNFTENKQPPPEENANDGWLGVSLKSRGIGGQVVACAHRYKRNEGMCHVFTQELTYEEQPYEPCSGLKTTRGHEDFGFCQAGISSELGEDGTLTVGTPGALNWRGGIFSIAVNRQDDIGIDKRWFSSEMNEYRSFVNKVSYLGMSITSGYYLGKGKQGMVYIAGAPRENLTGEVIMFRKQVDGKNRTLELLARIQGEQVAGQFGYSLASVDLNNDSLPDLVVGCPFYFQNDPIRGGAVYIYMNYEDGVQYAEPKKLLGPPDSSFGFAVANAGDLNLDGYSELAVGAPYDGGTGSIFIFQGSANGIVVEPSQIIRATDLPIPGLTTLGYSLSGGIDLDGNGYPDLLSGNFANDTVVLLRSRPVINVITHVNDLPKYVSDPQNPPKYCTDNSGKNLTCFSFRPCFQIASQHWNNFNGAMSIEYKIEAETFQKGNRVQYSRVKFQYAEDPPNIVTRQVVVTANSWNRALCDDSMKQTVLILDNTRDVLNPIWFKLTYTLLLDNPLFPREGAPLPRINDFPILDQTNASKIFDVKFYKDCGTNDICESDLRISAVLSLPRDDDVYILSLGENNQIFLNFTLRNENEAAYQTHLFVKHPTTLDYIGSDGKQYACSHLKDIPDLIRCDIGNPFPRNGEVNISMRFNTTNLQPLDREVSVTLWANTTSTQLNPEKPLNISANIVVRADIEVRGASDPTELFYSGVVTGSSAMRREEDIGLSVNHTYEIRNKGPAKVSSSKVIIRWPLEIENGHKHGKYLLYLLQEPILDGPVICKVDSKYINPIGVKRTAPPVSILSRDDKDDAFHRNPSRSMSKSGASQSTTAPPRSLSRVKREKIVAFEERIIENKKFKVVRLDCDRGTAKCIEIHCQIRELNRDQPVVIRLRARLWNSTFIEDYRDIDTIEIKSRVEVIVDTSYHVDDPKGNNVASVLTIAKPDVSIKTPSEGLAWWWILLAVLCGLLLLLVLIFILYRCKFFARKKPETNPRRQTPSDIGDDEHENKRAISPQSDE